MITFLPYLSDGGWWLVVGGWYQWLVVGGWLYNDNLVVAGGVVCCFVVLLFGQLDNQTTVISSACDQPTLNRIMMRSWHYWVWNSALSRRAW